SAGSGGLDPLRIGFAGSEQRQTAGGRTVAGIPYGIRITGTYLEQCPRSALFHRERTNDGSPAKDAPAGRPGCLAYPEADHAVDGPDARFLWGPARGVAVLGYGSSIAGLKSAGGQ